MALRIALYSVVALLAAAHFLRAGLWVAVIFCVATPLLFLYRHRLSLIMLQLLAYAAGGVWIYTAFHLVQARELAGRPWALGASILLAVALLSVSAGLVLNAKAARDRYPWRQRGRT